MDMDLALMPYAQDMPPTRDTGASWPLRNLGIWRNPDLRVEEPETVTPRSTPEQVRESALPVTKLRSQVCSRLRSLLFGGGEKRMERALERTKKLETDIPSEQEQVQELQTAFRQRLTEPEKFYNHARLLPSTMAECLVDKGDMVMLQRSLGAYSGLATRDWSKPVFNGGAVLPQEKQLEILEGSITRGVQLLATLSDKYDSYDPAKPEMPDRMYALYGEVRLAVEAMKQRLREEQERIAEQSKPTLLQKISGIFGRLTRRQNSTAEFASAT